MGAKVLDRRRQELLGERAVLVCQRVVGGLVEAGDLDERVR
jgi:hypothetical protein